MAFNASSLVNVKPKTVTSWIMRYGGVEGGRGGETGKDRKGCYKTPLISSLVKLAWGAKWAAPAHCSSSDGWSEDMGWGVGKTEDQRCSTFGPSVLSLTNSTFGRLKPSSVKAKLHKFQLWPGIQCFNIFLVHPAQYTIPTGPLSSILQPLIPPQRMIPNPTSSYPTQVLVQNPQKYLSPSIGPSLQCQY